MVRGEATEINSVEGAFGLPNGRNRRRMAW